MNKLTAIGAAFLMLGLIMLALISSDVYTMAFKKVNMDDKTFKNYKEGEIAEGDIGKNRFLIAKIGNMEVRKKIFGLPLIKKDSSLYLVELGNGGGYILIQVSDEREKFDELLSKTEAAVSQSDPSLMEHTEFIGKAIEVTDEQMNILKRFFDEKNVEEEYWQRSTSLYVLVQFDKTLVIIELIVSCSLIFLGVMLIMAGRRSTFGQTVYVGEKPPIEEGAEGAEKEEATEVSEAEEPVEKAEN